MLYIKVILAVTRMYAINVTFVTILGIFKFYICIQMKEDYERDIATELEFHAGDTIISGISDYYPSHC